jgi:stress response protein SCP2/predicted type IV restriction endonuclease
MDNIELIKGQNIGINDKKINIKMEWKSNINTEIDISIFMLSDNKITDNNDFIYFNNTKNLAIELTNRQNSSNIIIDFASINKSIDKLPIIITVNKENDFSSLNYFKIELENQAFYILNGVKQEKSIILAEVYKRKDCWKFKIIASGFNNGLETISKNYGLNLSSLSPEEKEKKFRKRQKDVILDKISELKSSFENLKPLIDTAVSQKYNESDTRMILDKIFMDILGYSINEVKTEQRIQGRRADYILSVGDINEIVVEAKKTGMKLREKQVFQATSYGAYSGIKWALLTNLTEWQLYYINSGDKIEPELVFSIDLNNLDYTDLEMLFAVSRSGITRKNLLTKIRAKNRALSQANIISTLVTDDVLNKIRTTINKDSIYKVSNEEIQHVLEHFLDI